MLNWLWTEKQTEWQDIYELTHYKNGMTSSGRKIFQTIDEIMEREYMEKLWE